MLDPDNLAELGLEFESAYSIWTAAQKTGMDPLFVRIQLRKLSTLVHQLETSEDVDNHSIIDGLWPKITEVNTALEHLRAVQLANEDSRQIIECLSDIPELMLLEIDQLLGTQITSEMLSDFELTEEE
jgi:hypothetical protein